MLGKGLLKCHALSGAGGPTTIKFSTLYDHSWLLRSATFPFYAGSHIERLYYVFVLRNYGNKLGCRGPGSVSGGTGLDLCRGNILGIKRFLKQSSISLRTKGLLRILSGAANAEASD